MADITSSLLGKVRKLGFHLKKFAKKRFAQKLEQAIKNSCKETLQCSYKKVSIYKTTVHESDQ